jgi:shikimate 5-dehydrogenase
MIKYDYEPIFCGSFSRKAGSMGMKLHNLAAKHYDLDFYYKSFSVTYIDEALAAMSVLNMRGVGISMPFKVEALQYVDDVTPEVTSIGATNTILNVGGDLIAYNTDWVAAKTVIEQTIGGKSLTILGDGGYAKAVKYAGELLDLDCRAVTRSNWGEINTLRNSLVFNCTPVKGIEVDPSCTLIESGVDSATGKELAMLQAAVQFELYTGKPFPFSYVKAMMGVS